MQLRMLSVSHYTPDGTVLENTYHTPSGRNKWTPLADSAQCSQLVLESSAWFSFRVCMVQLPFLHAKLCSPIKFHFPFIAHKKKSLYTGRICTSVRVYEKTTPNIYSTKATA